MVRCMPPYHPRWPSAAPAGSFRRPQGWTSAPWGRNLAKKNDDFPLYNQGEGLIICNPGLPDMFFLPPRNKSKAAQIRMGVFSAFVLKGRMYLAKPPKWGCSDQCPETSHNWSTTDATTGCCNQPHWPRNGNPVQATKLKHALMVIHLFYGYIWLLNGYNAGKTIKKKTHDWEW